MWAGVVWQRPYDRSRIGRSPHRRPLRSPSLRKWWPRPATPWSEKGTQPPRPCGPRAASLRLRVTRIGREGPKFSRNLLSCDARQHRRLDQREAGPRGEQSRGQHRLCLVRVQSSDKRNSYPCAPTFQRPRSQRVTRAANQGTCQARKRIHPTWWRDLLPTKRETEGAEPEQEEAMGAEPSAHLELAILNGLDISSLPALRDLSTGASTAVNIPRPPAGMERATPEWRQKASQAMALLLGGRSGAHYSNWSDALGQRPECRLDPPDTTTRRGIWTARMHNSTVCRVLDGLVAARATEHREPEDMNEILRDIPPRRGVLPIPGPARGSPRVDETFPETGE